MELINDLKTNGYAIAEVGTLEEYRNLSNSLGKLWFEADITLKPGRSYGAHNPDKLDFHTDAPSANIVGWFAEIPGAPTLLKDMANLEVSQETMEILQDVKCACPSVDRKEFSHHSVFKIDHERLRIYYAPWFVQRDRVSNEQREAIRMFEDALKPIPIISIRIEKGQALYVDNGRMLHGRGPLPEKSNRLLKRHWINLNQL